VKGVYQHCAKSHLQLHLAEFDCQIDNRVGSDLDDTQRAPKALLDVVGKRLMYRDSSMA